MILSLIKNKTQLVTTNGNTKMYDLVPVENRKDEYSSWSFDPFADHLKLYIELESQEKFPKIWKLSENVSINILV